MVERQVFSNQGQITIESGVGKEIVHYFLKYKPTRILEIGTWNGLGSTRCILNAISQYDFTSFISLESNSIKHSVAVRNNREFISDKVQILNATILDEQDWVDAKSMFKIHINESWFQDDYESFKKIPNIFPQIQELDAIFLDGGEYTTYQEYKKLLPLCKGLIFLDDTLLPFTCKCAKIVEELLENKEWECIYNTTDRNGFAIFKHIDFQEK